MFKWIAKMMEPDNTCYRCNDTGVVENIELVSVSTWPPLVISIHNKPTPCPVCQKEKAPG